VSNVVAHHSLADVEALHRGLEPDLAQYPDRPGLVRDVLWVADLTSGPRGQRLTIDERLTDVVLCYGRDHLVSEFRSEPQGPTLPSPCFSYPPGFPGSFAWAMAGGGARGWLPLGADTRADRPSRTCTDA
jgi:hypothetical protein